jgi:hypothetical protein
MYDRHKETPKHKKDYNELHESCEKVHTKAQCHCGKTYKYRQGLWKHQQLCVKEESTQEKEETVEKSSDNQQLLDYLIKQNQELQKQIMDVCKNGIINNSVTNVNSNNKTFNLQLFLNEECKDAMDIKDFIDSIQFQLADVESVGELVYVNGISKIIIQNLNALDTNKRPVHCTDEKRETIYIKDAGVWTKDDDNNKLRRMIQSVSNRNFKHTRLYREKHPDCNQADSRYSDTYNKIVLEATGGGSKCNDTDSENKIMRKIAKVIGIDKHNHS